MKSVIHRPKLLSIFIQNTLPKNALIKSLQKTSAEKKIENCASNFQNRAAAKKRASSFENRAVAKNRAVAILKTVP